MSLQIYCDLRFAAALRYRDIADRLIISESTVKFHMNNVLKNLKAQTRYQALHHASLNGWIEEFNGEAHPIEITYAT